MAEGVYPVPERLLQDGQEKPFIDSLEKYKAMWTESIKHPETFFAKLAKDLLSWSMPFETVQNGSFVDGNVGWFLEGELNAAYNCIDRHAFQHPDKVALIHEGDEPDNVRKFTYDQLLREVCRLANVLRSFDVRKGDTVIIYMPMIPEAVFAMLACARIGAIHSVVFAGFSAESLRDRIRDCGTRLVITADEGRRGGRSIATKFIVDEALQGIDTVERVLVCRRTGAEVNWVQNRDVWYHEEILKARPYCPPMSMNAEDPLFILYTSGSTGTPKGVMHSTAGYLLEAAATVKYVFDCHDEDIFACMADIGWITGHSYIVYGPLALGVTTVLFESTPTYPDPSRFWRIIDQHKITHFYTAPTALRALRRLGDEWVQKWDLSTLRVIGSVGEPINPETWEWYYQKVGQSRCAVVDTYWQTETGSIVISPLPGAVAMKPGSATVPFFGIEPVILDPHTGERLEGDSVSGVLAIAKPWPSMARTLYNNHQRYMDTYFNVYRGYYFTGDGASRDKDGYYWIGGRVDDVINVSGHRLSTAEIESALVAHEAASEAAVIGGHDDLTGQSIHAFCTLKPGVESVEGLEKELILHVRRAIGPFATPKRVYVVHDVPKTRSGKIMRRILRKIVDNEADQIGDTSTLANPHVIQDLIKQLKTHIVA
ncbi:acetyl-coenzyme A synthetase [Radiomyces spectabilis]|uniref:acetyl-coenzyme A synthetase n=1 Tax=Radiomyces spectabilis TaxID=64574 RepID=UPI00221E8A4F|nr:acetyl-coenzyme A synthetase [Radiomyces spectabilis]KAI8366727.1 acetyl-coenzyme A synthetase [Radiomyces spectabilis]